MALDAIKKSILDEADSRSAAIAEESERQADAVMKEASERSKQIIRSAEADSAREVERLRRESASGVDMEVNAILLDARGRALERALKAAIGKVASAVEKGGMERILESSVKQFSSMIGSDDILVRTSKKNAPLLKGKGYEVEYADVDGFMLYTRDGKVALNATVRSIVDGELDYARRAIDSELFGAGTQAAPKRAPRASRKPRGRKKG